jgi:hypothetical protein
METSDVIRTLVSIILEERSLRDQHYDNSLENQNRANAAEYAIQNLKNKITELNQQIEQLKQQK